MLDRRPFTLLTLLLAFAGRSPTAQEPAPAATVPVPVVKPYRLANRVEEIVLVDLDGKEHALFAENPGKALVIVFWSYRDPVSRFYAPELAALQARHAEKLAIVLVDANHDEIAVTGDPMATIKDVVRREKVTLPVLIDAGNRLADDFEAKANAQAFVLDANRFLRYHGGIDDDPKGERRKQGIPVLAKLGDALDAVLAGQTPEYPWTIPAGRPIKRAPRSRPADAGSGSGTGGGQR